jgi:hypothetical protein
VNRSLVAAVAECGVGGRSELALADRQVAREEATAFAETRTVVAGGGYEDDVRAPG